MSRRPAIVPKSDAVLLVRAGHGIIVPVDVRGAGRNVFFERLCDSVQSAACLLVGELRGINEERAWRWAV